MLKFDKQAYPHQHGYTNAWKVSSYWKKLILHTMHSEKYESHKQQQHFHENLYIITLHILLP